MNAMFFKAYIKRRRLPQVKKEKSKKEETSSKIENAQMVFKTTIRGIFNFLSFPTNRNLQAISKLHSKKNKNCWDP